MLAAVASLALAPAAGATPGNPVPPKIRVAIVPDASGDVHLVHETELFFTFANEPNCPPPHYHAFLGDHEVVATDGTVIPDPSPDACGYGIALAFTEIFFLIAGDADGDGLPDTVEPGLGLDPNSQDSDGDGIPDPLEDLDGDGLRNDEEIHVHCTDPLDPRSADPELLDGVKVALDQTAADFYKIPVLVNILRRSGPDGATDPNSFADPFLLREGFAKANEILKQAKIMLFPLFRSISPAENAAYDPSGDGIIEQPLGLGIDDEVRGAFDQGNQEVGQLLGGKGMKAVVARSVASRALTVLSDVGGLAQIGGRTVLLSMNPGGLPADENKLGVLIAHEVSHGLGFPHSDDLPDPTLEELSPLNLLSSDEPDVAIQRFMAVMGADTVSIITLSPRQIAQIRSKETLGEVGLKGRKQSPGQLVQQQIGTAVDPRGDATAGSPEPLDLAGARAASEEGSDQLDLAVDVHGLFPDADPINVSFRFRIDEDDDGVAERLVDLLVLRQVQGGPLELGASVQDPFFTSLNQPLLTPTLEVIRQLSSGAPDPPDDPAGTRLRVSVPFASLSLVADPVPITVQAIEGTPDVPGSLVRDTLGPFDFDRTFSSGLPTLTLTQESAGPGDLVPFTIAGLQPQTNFDVLVDATEVFSSFLDPSGGFSGSFVWPDGMAPGFHFVTAVSGSRFAFNAIDAVTPPGDLDFDDDLDEDDRDVILAAFGLTPSDAGWVAAADLDGDGQITFVDYQLWLELFGAASASTSCGLGPEALALALAALTVRRRRLRRPS